MGNIAAIATIGFAALLITGCTASTMPGGGHAAAMGVAVKRAAPVQLRLKSVSPVPGAVGVDGTSPITVTYSAPVPSYAPLPVVSPAIAGTWQRHGDTAVFTPETGFPAKTRVTVTVPAVTSGAPGGTGTVVPPPARGAASVRPASTSGDAAVSFRTGAYSTLRLQEILAQLGYLPLAWSPARGAAGTSAAQPGAAGISADGIKASGIKASGTGTAGTGTAPATARQELFAAYAPPAGSFTWASGYPGMLHSFWAAGRQNTLTRGAVTGFEADHGMPPDGVAGPKVWAALLTAALAHQVAAHGYSYAVTDEHSPESLTIWHDGKLAFHSVANTGISVEPTPIGTFPVYEKLTFQVMRGTNPDGSHYADPVKWVSYFSGGSAVHYFPRSTFGWPQSLGCVELPYSAAEQAYPLLPYGTLVTVLAG